MREMPQVVCPLTHHFGAGVYIREIFIPAGTIVVGHRHKGPGMNILMMGTLRVIDGSGMARTIQAPAVFVAPPGSKVLFALEDSVFQNVHPTDETDLEKFEELFIEKSETPELQRVIEEHVRLLSEE